MMGTTKPIGVTTMVRHKECGGTKEKLDVVCEAGLLQSPAGGDPEPEGEGEGEGAPE